MLTEIALRGANRSAGRTMSEFHDLEFIGEKIVEMTDRVKVMHAALSGSQAKWIVDGDGIASTSL